ncbi:CRP-like cAMP-binding protein [Chitinophaga skermanii]|uniref:CRP-like cAMP-binding protein n=1 Tax=Chitinophaga skermanii TaxID=331697 RepID=A0A327R3K1_9BACT|nr:Crp/Fnr family transcriptional regulator [Chitinophaga skermanii]RAJ08457.1 CRP-like cAMP-binding protein [Chitinophaga skermanii]
MNTHPPLQSFLQHHTTLTPQEYALVSQYAETTAIEAGHVLLSEGKIAKKLFFVNDGYLKIVTTNEKGNDVIQFFIKPHKFCTILYSFKENVPSQESILAATDASITFFTKENLAQLYSELPHLQEAIERITHNELLSKIQARNQLMGEEATIRYQRLVANNPDLLQHVPLSDIASFLGITQQSLSRIRKSIS